MCMGWPQPKMYLWLSSSFCAVSVSRVRTVEECCLELMVSWLHIHLGSSFNLMLSNHGLSARRVPKICSIEKGEGMSSQVEIPVSTPSMTMRGHGLSSLMDLISWGVLVRRCVIEFASGLRSEAMWPSRTIKMQLPARLQVTPVMRILDFARLRELFTLVII